MFSIKKILILCGLLTSTQIFALPQDSRRAGGIAVIPLSQNISEVKYKDQPILITQPNTQRYAIFGIPLSTPIGSLELQTTLEC